jgi:hypothetical protein
MKYKIMLAGVIFIIVIALFVGCAKKEYEVVNPEKNVTGDVILNSFVTDKDSKAPIEGAIVILGGYYECYTNREGRCSINISVSGEYGLESFRKGYNRSLSQIVLQIGQNNFSIELEKKPNMPESFVTEGKIIEIVFAKGTRSEDHIFKIKRDSGEEYNIFNEMGKNTGFSSYVNKRVRITGFNEAGFIGWAGTPSEGIYVEEIQRI